MNFLSCNNPLQSMLTEAERNVNGKYVHDDVRTYYETIATSLKEISASHNDFITALQVVKDM